MIRPVLPVLAAFSVATCIPPETQHVDLAQHATLPAHIRTQFAASTTLRTPGDNNQVCLAPAPPFSVDDSLWGIRTRDGATANVAGVLVRPDGRTDSLESLVIWGDSTDYLCLMLRVGDAPSSTYSAVALTSSRSIELEKVFWLSTYK